MAYYNAQETANRIAKVQKLLNEKTLTSLSSTLMSSTLLMAGILPVG